MTDYEKAQDAAWRAFFVNNARNFKTGANRLLFNKELFKRSIIGCCHDFGAGLPKGADISWTYSKLLVANCLRCGLDIPMDAKEFLGAISERMGRIV